MLNFTPCGHQCQSISRQKDLFEEDSVKASLRGLLNVESVIKGISDTKTTGIIWERTDSIVEEVFWKVQCHGKNGEKYFPKVRCWVATYLLSEHEPTTWYNILLIVEDCLAKSWNMFLGWPNVCAGLNAAWYVFNGAFPTQLEPLMEITIRAIVST